MTSGDTVDFAKLHVFEMKDPLSLPSILAFFGALLKASTFAQDVLFSSENVTELLNVELVPARFTPSKKGGGQTKTVGAKTLFYKLNKYAIDQKYAFGRFIVSVWRCKANHLPELIHSQKRVKGVRLSTSSVVSSAAHQEQTETSDSIKVHVSQAREDEDLRKGIKENTDKSCAWRDVSVRAVCQKGPYLTTLFNVYGYTFGEEAEAPVFYLRQLAIVDYHIRNYMINGVGAVNKAIRIDDIETELKRAFVAAGFTKVENANPFDNHFSLFDYPPSKSKNILNPTKAGEEENESTGEDE